MTIWYPDIPNIDLREELAALLRGRVDLIPQGKVVLHRQLTDTRCACFNGLEGGPNRQCRYCDGEGYQFYERELLAYIARGVAPIYKPGFLANGQYPQGAFGYIDPNKATGYLEHDAFPDYERYTLQTKQNNDKLYEVKVDDNGVVLYPMIKTIKWKILNVTPLFGDFGRIEYHEISLEREI